MRGAIGLVAVLVVAPLSSDLGLKPLHPDETVEQSINQRFSADNALRTLATVQEMLDSLSMAVISRHGTECKRRLAAIEARFGDGITVGIANYPTILEGTIRLQRFTIADLRHELVTNRHAHGEESREAVENARDTLETASQEFTDFWQDARVAD